MLGLRYRRVLNPCLGVLLLVGSTSVSVSHAHERGDRPHAHGFGIVAWPAPAPGSGTTGAMTRHRHVVLLGFEFYLADPTGPGAPASTEDVEFGVGVATPDDGPAPDTAVRPAPVFASVLPVPSEPLPVGQVPDACPPRCVVCDQARGERTGVHLL